MHVHIYIWLQAVWVCVHVYVPVSACLCVCPHEGGVVGVVMRVNTKHLVKDHFLTLACLFGTICPKHSATLILPHLLKPPSRCTCLIIISKLFFTTGPLPSSNAECVSVSVVSVIVKCPMLPPCVVGGRSRNPLYYYYYYYFFCSPVLRPVSVEEADTLGWDSEQARLASTVAVTGQ